MGNAKGKVILFLGGARSGKSAFAEKIASKHDRVAYVATAQDIDDEMRERIKKHQKSRPNKWVTYEVDKTLRETIGHACQGVDVVIIDCLTIYVSRRMEKTVDDDEIIKEIVEAVKSTKSAGKIALFVSNEVGMGLVPDYPVGRRYRDLLGKVNQEVAKLAGSVLFTIAGIPVDIKSLKVNDS